MSKKAGKYFYGAEVDLLDEEVSLETTFGPEWQKVWIVYHCGCDRRISRPLMARQRAVKCDNCDSVIRKKGGKWFRSL